MSRRIYVIGSLRNPNIPKFAKRLRDRGHYVFDDWFSAGEHADDSWRDYEKARGRSYAEALNSAPAINVFRFDEKNLHGCDTVVLLMPAGKSGHLELGYSIGRGAEGFILFDGEPERWDVMYRFCKGVYFNEHDLFVRLALPWGL